VSAPGDGGSFWQGVGKVVGGIWNAPNTLIGLLYGGIGHGIGELLGTDPEVGVADGQIQFRNNPLTSTAITFGRVGVFSSGSPPTDRGPSGATIGVEEFQHTRQGNVLGPLYLPAHLAFGTASVIQQAAGGNFNLVRAWHGPVNILETGPHTPPPRPWP
jgi:hypothetical protein